MMHFRGLVHLTLFLPVVARRSFRLADSHHDAQQQNNIVTKTLEGSAEAREALLPGVIRSPIHTEHQDPTHAFRPFGPHRATADRLAPPVMRGNDVAARIGAVPGSPRLSMERPAEDSQAARLGWPFFSRRALGLAAAATALAPEMATAAGKDAYACRGDENCGMSESATKAFTESSVAGKAGIRFSGSYSDPTHPGCERKISLQGKGAILTGADEDKKKFKFKAVVDGKALIFDSLPGYSKPVRAEYNGVGLVFPDGTMWTKLR